MAVRYGWGPRPAAHTAKRCFLNCLETIASNLAVSWRQLGSKDPVAGLKHHGSEGRTGPAGHGRECLTLLSEPTRKPSCLTQNGACATAKQQGPEGRTRPAGIASCFLLLLSCFLAFLPLLLVMTCWPLLLAIPPLTRSPCCKRGRRYS